jgi:hypothetical protein
MTAFETQKAADEATEALTNLVAAWAREEGHEATPAEDNGTLPEYGGGYCTTLTIDGEDFHVEIISPYVEGDEG